MDKNNRPVVPQKPKMPKYDRDDNLKAHSHVITDSEEFEAVESPSEIALIKANNGLIKLTVVERRKVESYRFKLALKEARKFNLSTFDDIEFETSKNIDKYLYKNLCYEALINIKSIKKIIPSIDELHIGRKTVDDELEKEARAEIGAGVRWFFRNKNQKRSLRQDYGIKIRSSIYV